MRNILRVLADVNVGAAFDDVNIPGKGQGAEAADMVLNNVLTVAFFALGVVGVIILIYGGIQFMISQGDAGKAQRARQTIIYAIIGIVIVIAAGAITNFVLGAL